jgi:hypothetical protein
MARQPTKESTMRHLTFALFVLLLCVDGWGCSGETPPSTFSIDADFSEAEAAQIRSAVDSWCMAVDYCPEETDDPTLRGRFVWTATTARDHTPAVNDGWRIPIATVPPVAERRAAWTIDIWTIAAHEIGHWCSREGGVDGWGHTRDGLLQPAPPLSTTIDARAIDAWHEGCP